MKTHSLYDKDIESGVAICSICGPVKIRKAGTGWMCAKKDNETRRKYNRARNLKNRFDLSIEDFNSMLKEQKFVCAICGLRCSTGKELAVDHDHETGKVRGLLCAHCNIELGYFRDNPELLVKATEYLENT